jgi:hypothetical protein
VVGSAAAVADRHGLDLRHVRQMDRRPLPVVSEVPVSASPELEPARLLLAAARGSVRPAAPERWPALPADSMARWWTPVLDSKRRQRRRSPR